MQMYAHWYETMDSSFWSLEQLCAFWQFEVKNFAYMIILWCHSHIHYVSPLVLLSLVLSNPMKAAHRLVPLQHSPSWRKSFYKLDYGFRFGDALLSGQTFSPAVSGSGEERSIMGSDMPSGLDKLARHAPHPNPKWQQYHKVLCKRYRIVVDQYGVFNDIFFLSRLSMSNCLIACSFTEKHSVNTF